MFHYENPEAKHWKKIVNECDLFFAFTEHTHTHILEWHVFDEFSIDIMIECCPRAAVYDKVVQIEKLKNIAHLFSCKCKQF